MLFLIRYVWASLSWVLVWHISYRIRPYDMLADRRRWFWQPRSNCLCLVRHGVGCSE